MASPPGENSYYPGSKSAKSISSSSVPTTSKPIPVKQIQPNEKQNQNQQQQPNQNQQQNQQQQQQQRGAQQQQQFPAGGGSEYALAFQRNGVINDASLDVWGRVREFFCLFSIQFWILGMYISFPVLQTSEKCFPMNLALQIHNIEKS